jgi:peptidoglycan/LPS O-acetylase OafA/YrhL
MSSVESSRMAFVDSLRFIAAALVLVQHLADRMTAPAWRSVGALSPGVAGVALFFLISGFVIPLSVRHGFDPGRFVLRRLLRIYPLYLAALALLVAGAGLGLLPEWAWLGTAKPQVWLANLLLVQDYVGQRPILGVSWTLIIELAWYGIFAAALLVLKDRAAAALSLLLPAGILGIAAVSLALGLRIPVARIGMVYAAALGFQAFRYHCGVTTLRVLLGHLLMFLLVMALAIGVSFGVFQHAKMSLGQALVPWMLVPVLFTALVVRREWQSLGVLSTGILPTLGSASYSLYLLHPIAISFLFARAAPQVAVLLAVPAAMGLALAGYNWVERPGIALARRMTRPVPVREANPA